jgi:hypothetical protein
MAYNVSIKRELKPYILGSYKENEHQELYQQITESLFNKQ